jgi:hypothetical protein
MMTIKNWKRKVKSVMSSINVTVFIIMWGLIWLNSQSLEADKIRLQYAKCDDRPKPGAVFIKFSDGSEWHCIPAAQLAVPMTVKNNAK